MISAGTLPRLLAAAGTGTTTLDQHGSLFGGGSAADPLRELERSGLLGRGGGGFETFRKVSLIKEQRSNHKVVVVNAMEGEPAAYKDAHLLRTNPHLVLDGAEVLAGIVHADHIIVCVARDRSRVIDQVHAAIAEREGRAGRAGRGLSITLETPPGRYVAGEESALVHWLNDHESLPQFRPEKPSILKLRRHPVLVENAETCADVALIARFGATWFRSLGTASHPGSTLVTVSGGVDRPKVLEVAIGTPVRQILAAASADTAPQAIVVGGYGGVIMGPEILDLPYSNDSFGPLGASVGAGILCPIPAASCGLAEMGRVVAWMANESARQCGPCAFGLPALSDDLSRIVHGTRDAREALHRLHQRTKEIEGRGACRHPDGVIRFVRTGLATFEGDVTKHVSGAPCSGVRVSPRLMVPTLTNEEGLVWD